jgi:hypothetical protein
LFLFLKFKEGHVNTFNSETSAMDARARRAAKRAGLVAKKSRWRQGTLDNHGGFMLIEPHRNNVLAGVRFDWSAEDVIGFCDNRAGAAS